MPPAADDASESPQENSDLDEQEALGAGDPSTASSAPRKREARVRFCVNPARAEREKQQRLKMKLAYRLDGEVRRLNALIAENPGYDHNWSAGMVAGIQFPAYNQNWPVISELQLSIELLAAEAYCETVVGAIERGQFENLTADHLRELAKFSLIITTDQGNEYRGEAGAAKRPPSGRNFRGR